MKSDIEAESASHLSIDTKLHRCAGQVLGASDNSVCPPERGYPNSFATVPGFFCGRVLPRFHGRLRVNPSVNRFKLAPTARVVESLDIVKDIRSGISPGPVFPPVDALAFQQSKEALHGGIVRTATHTTHAAYQVMPLQEALVLATGKLTAPIGMQDHW